MLYTCVEQAPSDELEDREVIKQHFGKFEEKFFNFCDKELLKINTFFAGKSRISQFGQISDVSSRPYPSTGHSPNQFRPIDLR